MGDADMAVSDVLHKLVDVAGGRYRLAGDDEIDALHALIDDDAPTKAKGKGDDAKADK